MMRSMFSAISGLKNHQTFMDVVGNNIANVNTTGFKQSRVTFQDILSQTVRGASGPQGGRGGVNAEQIGLGVLTSGIDTIQTQGTLQSTGKSTDMAIQGDGYFVMSDGKQNFYTRDGAFDLALDGTLASAASGLHVMGWQADPVTGLVNTTVPATNITVPIGAGMTGKGSTSLTVTGNLDSRNLGGAANAVTLSSTVYDAQGNALPITLTAVKSATTPDNWTVTASGSGATGSSTLVFNGQGKVATGGTGTISITLTNGATTPQSVSLDLAAMTQLSATSNLSSNTDGASAGSLTSFTVGQAGDITGVYSNGYKQPLGQIALASFSNPSGLIKAGGNLYTNSANSGTANIGTPDSAGRGQIATGFLEGSNVDLAQQFTNMIMAERGFQANSKVITTSDEILMDLVNLKH
ncbi:MAG TPA: flagellar hook protein FlgE [Chloroflexota bacterium]|jgi:flagellar hook protein FlgE|nr:flagellar hook protein FlgE [Chloroflexota bacterium]